MRSTLPPRPMIARGQRHGCRCDSTNVATAASAATAPPALDSTAPAAVTTTTAAATTAATSATAAVAITVGAGAALAAANSTSATAAASYSIGAGVPSALGWPSLKISMLCSMRCSLGPPDAEDGSGGVDCRMVGVPRRQRRALYVVFRHVLTPTATPGPT